MHGRECSGSPLWPLSCFARRVRLDHVFNLCVMVSFVSLFATLCLSCSKHKTKVFDWLCTCQLSSTPAVKYSVWQGAQPALHFGGGGSFMKFHSMTSSCLFNRGTSFSQTVTYNNNYVFLPPDTKSIVQTHTFCKTLVNKNRQKTKQNVLQQRWRLNHRCQAKFLTSRHMRMRRATFNISNTLRQLMIRA